jgi:uncharacterized membrane protein YkoI
MRYSMAIKYITKFFIFAVAIGIAAPGYAQEKRTDRSSLSREEITDNLKKGEVLDYETILSTIKRSPEDRIIEAELISYDGLIIYHIEILKPTGVVDIHLIDGKTGEDASHLRDQ